MKRWFLGWVVAVVIGAACTDVDDTGPAVVEDISAQPDENDVQDDAGGLVDIATPPEDALEPDDAEDDASLPPADSTSEDAASEPLDTHQQEPPDPTDVSPTDVGGSDDAETSLDGAEEDAGAGDDAGVDEDAGEDAECGTAVMNYKGSLCGNPGKPCVMSNAMMLAVPPGFTNGSPDIAINENDEVAVLHWRAVGGYAGHYWGPDGLGAVVAEELPMAVARGAVSLEPDGTPSILVTDGTSAPPTLWRRTDGVWNQLGLLDGVGASVNAFSLERDSVGCLHAALAGLSVMGEGTTYWRHVDGGWNLLATLGETGGSRALALGPDGVPYVAWWGTKGVGWTLDAQRVGDETEAVLAIGSVLGDSEIRMAVSGTDSTAPGTPWIFMRNPDDFASAYPDGSLLVATRPPLGGWSVNTIQLPNDPGGELCNGPTFGADQCEADHWAFYPLAVVATDSPRFIYSAVHTTGSFASSCLGDWDKFAIPPPPDECEWIGETTVQSTLRVAWPDGPGYLSAEIGPAGAAMRGSAAVATDGRIHLVSYDETGVGSGTGYVILGEADDGPDKPDEEGEIPEKEGDTPK